MAAPAYRQRRLHEAPGRASHIGVREVPYGRVHSNNETSHARQNVRGMASNNATWGERCGVSATFAFMEGKAHPSMTLDSDFEYPLWLRTSRIASCGWRTEPAPTQPHCGR